MHRRDHLRQQNPRSPRILTVLLALGLGAAFADVAGAATSTSATISSNWSAFFNGATSAQRKIALLQDGSKFASIIKAQASLSLARSARAKVLKVSSITKTSARVRYSIYLGNTPALTNQNGSAVYQDGTWRVSDSSFCTLLSLEGTKTPNCHT